MNQFAEILATMSCEGISDEVLNGLHVMAGYSFGLCQLRNGFVAEVIIT